MSNLQTIIAPSHIGPYSFRGTVGEGAFSVVKLAFHEELHQYFACKIVPRNRVISQDLEERFEIEIRVNQQLHHPGIVQIIDLLKDDMNYYIFMEFCPNGELFRYIIDRQRLSEPEAQVIFLEILDALRYLHVVGVAHRDLKPENLLLDPTGHIKISDFGLSRFVGPGGMVSTPCGSPCYASPECLSGDPYDGRNSDIWSLGVILYAMVTGQLPWTKRNQTQLFNQIKKGEYTIPRFLSQNCKNIIKGLLCVDLSQRLTIDETLNHPWMSDVQAQKSLFENGIIPLKIVSLKQVDAFFDRTIPELDIDLNLNKRIPSTKSFQINSIVKLLNIKTPIKTRYQVPRPPSKINNPLPQQDTNLPALKPNHERVVTSQQGKRKIQVLLPKLNQNNTLK